MLFAGTPEFSVAPLQALLDAGYDVRGVYTQPDRPAGRGRKLMPSPVKQLAVEHGIPVYQPTNFKREEALAELEGLRADLMVVVAYGLLLPERVLNAPRLGCINIHASLLPRWRGAAPIQRAIQAGDEETGITIMRMDKGLDTGDMLYRLTCPIAPDETGGSLHDRLAPLGAKALMAALPGILSGELHGEPQNDAEAIYAHKLSKAESAIDWRQDAAAIERQVRAFNPWPVAQTRWNDANPRIWAAHALAGPATGEPGQVVGADRDGIRVACGKGQLCITRIQMPGKKAMPVADFLNAHALDGAVLGR